MEVPQGIDSKRSIQNLHPLLTAAVYLGLYYLGGMLGNWGTFKPGDFSAFWPPSGLCLAVLLLHKNRVWPWFFAATLVGSVLVEKIIHQHGIGIGLAFGVANFLQAAVGALLIKRFTGPNFTLGHVRHAVYLAVLTPLAALFSATVGIIDAWLAFDWVLISKLWVLWWLADVVGVLVVTPVVLAWVGYFEQKRSADWKGMFEAAVLFSVLIVAADVVFGPARPRYFELSFPFPYILLPFLLWGAMRFESHIAATASFVLAVIASVYTVDDCGPFNLAGYSQSGHAIILQVFIGVAALFSLFPGPIIRERRRALERISDLNSTLEQRVKDRTFALEESEQRFRSLADEQEVRVQERTLELSVLNEELKSAILVRENITHMLEESTGMQRAILDSANASIISTEPDGMIRTVNATAERWLKYHGKELVGKCNLTVLHDAMEMRARAELLGRQEGHAVSPDFGVLVANTKNGAMDESEWFYIRKDGSRMPVSLSVTALHDEKGATTGYLHIARDITERKQAEKALQESESNLRSFFNSASIMMGIVEIVDNDMVHISDNAASARFFGMTPESMRWRRASEIGIPKQGVELWIRNFLRSERTGYPVRFEYAHRTHEAACLLSVTVAFTAITPVGRARFSYIAEDITERKRSQEAMQRFAAILEVTTDFVAIADKSGQALFLNQAGRKMIGWGENEDITKFGISSFHPPWARELIQKEGIPVAMIEGVWQAETAILNRADQHEIPVSQLILSHKSADGAVEFISTIMRDMTERKLAEEKIRTSLQEKEILLKEIHHRVKNNMQVVSSMLQLQSGYIKDPVALAMFQECRDRIQSMALIHERLYQSRDLAEIDFAEYVRSLVSMLVYSHRPANMELRSRVDIESISLDLDTAIPVGLIVNELVINALKHAFKGRSQGTVVVGLKVVDDLRYELVISDDGAGIPDNFDIGASSSLGLRLVRILSKQIHGELSVSNKHGTQFRVIFNKPKIT
jgi:PAS domain S-box-containing protein